MAATEPIVDDSDEEDEVVIARVQREVRARRAAAAAAAAAAATAPEPEPAPPAKKRVGNRGRTNARRNPDNPQSRHAGVSWQAKNQKWRGQVPNTLKKTASGRKKHECTARFPRDQEEACAAAVEALRARIDGEYLQETERRAAADPLTRGLPRGPEDPAEAEEGEVYWRPNEKNNHMPFRAVRVSAGKQRGARWIRACTECASKAEQAKFGGGTSLYCEAHVPEEDRCPCTDFTGLRVHCQICRGKDAEAAGKVAPALGHLCSRCQDTRLAAKRLVSNGGNGLCPRCEATLNEEAREAGAEGVAPAKGKRWEDVCLDALIELVPHGIEMRDSTTHMLGSAASSKARKVRKVRAGAAADQDCDTTKRRRPDLLYVLRHEETGRIVGCIVVEVDEHSHCDYTPECEVGRCDDLFQALSVHAQREGFTSDAAGHTRPDAVHPVVYVLKLNPNACDAPKAVPLQRRIQALSDRINDIFDLPRDALVDAVVRGDAETLVPRVELFYYHTKRAAHHLQAYREAHDKGSLWFAGNVVS